MAAEKWGLRTTGSVVNLASRLCDEAKPGQIVISRPVFAEVEEMVETEVLADLTLKGFAKPVPALNVVRLRNEAVEDRSARAGRADGARDRGIAYGRGREEQPRGR